MKFKKTDKKTIGIGLIEHLGDIVACEPVARYLRNSYPDHYIYWVVLENYRELIDSNPNIDETIVVDCLTDWIKLTRHNFFDMIVDLHVNLRICQQCGIPLIKNSGNLRITGDNYFLYGNLLAAFSISAGLPPLDEKPEVYISDNIRKSVDDLNLPKDFIVFHCSSNMKIKDWDFLKWMALSNLIKKNLDIDIVEIGLKSIMEKNKNILNLCGKLSILETAEVIKRAKLFIGVDSGPAHLANAVNTYGIVLMGKLNQFSYYNSFSGHYGNETNAKIIRTDNLVFDIDINSMFESIEEYLNNNVKTNSIKSTSEKGNNCHNNHNNINSIQVQFNNNTNKIQQEIAKTIALYLPQFHPIPENDFHWGKGFTEWTNVTKAIPYFDGHYQPKLPTELGFYDLRLQEVIEAQSLMAKEYGIYGFCFYLYWFNGKKLLYKPIENMLKSKKFDMHFCFCLANENWTKRWDGQNRDIIIAQNHSLEDDVAFIKNFLPIFEDERYIKVDGKPVLLVYRTELFPDIRKTVDLWKEEARKYGFKDIYLIRCEGFDSNTKPQDISFDASYEVPVFYLPDELLYDSIYKLNIRADFEGKIFDYDKVANYYMINRKFPEYKRFKTVMARWDNTPRYGAKSVILYNESPEKYSEWLFDSLIKTAERYNPDEQFVFIHSWNEWAEGAFIEPDLRYGRKYLEATKRAIDSFNVLKDFGNLNISRKALKNKIEEITIQSNFSISSYLIDHLTTKQLQNNADRYFSKSGNVYNGKYANYYFKITNEIFYILNNRIFPINSKRRNILKFILVKMLNYNHFNYKKYLFKLASRYNLNKESIYNLIDAYNSYPDLKNIFSFESKESVRSFIEWVYNEGIHSHPVSNILNNFKSEYIKLYEKIRK